LSSCDPRFPTFYGVKGQEFWGIASPSDAYHLPQILAQELQPFGRSGDDFGEVFLRVRGFLFCSFLDSPRVLGGQSAARGQSTSPRGPFCGLFRQKCYFLAGGFFCTADSLCLSSGQSAPTPADSPRQLGGQSDLYAETCQVCSVPLLLP
jgi:hypothetical protein